MKRDKRVLIAGTCAVVFAFLPSFASATTTVPIFLDVRTASTTLFSGNVSVAACEPFDSATSTANGRCALDQSGLAVVWSPYGEDYFIDSIAGVANDYGLNQYWGWFANNEYGQTAINRHVLANNERLLVAIGRMPLKIEAATTTPAFGATTTVSVYEFGFDESWNGVWLPAASSSISFGGESFFTASGTYGVSVATTTPFTVTAEKAGFIDASLVFSPIAAATSTDEGAAATTTPPAGSQGGGGGATYHHVPDVSSMISFLANNQRDDGSFGSSIYTDWAAMALASAPYNSEAKTKAESYLTSAPGSLSSATDYERRAMALMALGISPYDGTSIDYIAAITAKFDGTQMGEKGLVNDDVFALFPLIRAGYSPDDSMVTAIAQFIVSKQRPDGSWEGSVDLTAAAVQALELVSVDGASDARFRAREYLVSRQRSDGGFGSSFSTSWAIMALSSLGESASQWERDGRNPNDYLYSLQEGDGGIEPASADKGTRVWATAYAVPAVQGKTWADVLAHFSRPYRAPDSVQSGQTSSDTVVAATTTMPVVAFVATTTPAALADEEDAFVKEKEAMIARVRAAEQSVRSVEISGDVPQDEVREEVAGAEFASAVVLSEEGEGGGLGTKTSVALGVLVLGAVAVIARYAFIV